MNSHQNEQTNNESQTGGVQLGSMFRGGPSGEIPRTDFSWRFPITLLLFIFPMLMFWIFLGVDYDQILLNSNISGNILGDMFWPTPLITIGWLMFSQLIIYILVKKTEFIKADMYLVGFMTVGFMSGVYLIPQFWWTWRLLISFITGMAGGMIGKGFAMFLIIKKQVKQIRLAQKQLKEFQEQANTTPGSQPPPKSKEERKKQESDRMTAMMKQEREALDQMLREQGVDIDALDEKFGSALDSFENSSTVSVDKNDVEELKVHSQEDLSEDEVEIISEEDSTH